MSSIQWMDSIQNNDVLSQICVKNNMRVRYAKPTYQDMIILIPFFNPCKSTRLLQNLLLVRHSLESAHIPYFIAEMAFGNEIHEFSGPNVLQFRSTSYMFYKENLILSSEPLIPDEYTKLCIMDADIMFANPNWYDIVRCTLTSFNLCKPFSHAKLLNIDFTILDDNFRVRSDCAHPGFVWAYQRSWFQISGYIDLCIVGNGDCANVDHISEVASFPTLQYYKNEFPTMLPMPVQGSVGLCDLTVYHLYHGPKRLRQYHSRFEAIDILKKQLCLSYLEDAIVRKKNNILEWKDIYKDAFNTMFINYFQQRKDDSIIIKN
jgi:hypothetical protein